MRIMTAFTPNGFIALHSHAVLRLPPLLGYTPSQCASVPPCAAAEVAQGVSADGSIETPETIQHVASVHSIKHGEKN